MAETIKGINVTIGSDTTGLSKALGDVNKKSRDIQSELRQVEKLLKLDPKNTELVAQKQKLLSDAVQNSKQKLDSLKIAQEQVNEQFKNGGISEGQYRAFQREVAKTEEELKNLEKQLGSINSKWKESAAALGEFGNKTQELGNKIAPISAVAAGAATGMVALAVKSGQAADDLNTLSKVTGLSTETLQKFQYASDVIDVSMETLSGSLTKLTRTMGNANKGNATAQESFNKLGVSIYDASGNLRDNEEVFNDSIKALGNVANETERDALAMDIFGKSAKDLNPLILGGADALKELGDAAKEKGLIMSQEELDNINAFNDEIDILKATVGAELSKAGATIGQALLPVLQALSEAIKGILSWFSGLDEGTMKIILGILAVLAVIAPLLIFIGKISTGISAIMTLATTLGPIIAGLSGPILIIIGVITAIIAVGVLLWKNWDTIKEKAVELWTNLTETFSRIKDSVVNKWNEVMSGVKDVWNNITGFLSGLPGEMINFGKNIIEGLINGIKSMIGSVGSAIRGVADKVTGVIKFALGIHSPSRVMMEMGEYTGEGFALGIKGTIKEVAKQTNAMANAVNPKTQIGSLSANVNGNYGMGDTVIYAQVVNNLDSKPIATVTTPMVIKSISRNQSNRNISLGRG